jgi:outer membrane protein assembly factor BamB
VVNDDGKVRWTAGLRPDLLGGDVSAVSSSSTVFADEGGDVTALALRSGKRLWERPLGSSIYAEWLTGSTLVADVDQVSRDAEVVGLDPKSGTIKWRFRVGGEGLFGTPVPSGRSDLAIVLGDPSRLAVLDTANGHLQWAETISSKSQPVVGDGVVAIDIAGALRGFDLLTGQERWEKFGLDANGALSFDDGTVLVASNVAPDPTPITAVSISNGAPRFTLRLRADYGPVTATSSGFLLTQQNPVDHGGLALINPTTGAVAWEATARTASWQSMPATSGKYLATIEGRPNNSTSYYQLRGIEDGQLVVDTPLSANSHVAGLTGDGGERVFEVGDDDSSGGFVALLAGATTPWSVRLPQIVQAPALAVSGGAYIQTENPVCASAV